MSSRNNEEGKTKLQNKKIKKRGNPKKRRKEKNPKITTRAQLIHLHLKFTPPQSKTQNPNHAQYAPSSRPSTSLHCFYHPPKQQRQPRFPNSRHHRPLPRDAPPSPASNSIRSVRDGGGPWRMPSCRARARWVVKVELGDLCPPSGWQNWKRRMSLGWCRHWCWRVVN